MPLITEADLKKQIKSRSFSPVYVLCGSEQLYIRQYTKLLTDAVTGKAPSDFNFHRFSGEVNLDTVASAIGVVPFMSEYNCVLLTDIFLDMMSADELDKLKSICKMKAEGTVLILSMPSYVPKRNAKAWEAIQKRAQKDGSVVKFDKPTDDKLEKYIAKWANQQGKFITRLNAARLIKLCGNDLIIVAVVGEQLRCQTLDGRNNLSSHLSSFAQDVSDGFTDNGEQGEQDQQGNKAPQTAAHTHGSALFLLQLLNFFILLLLVMGISSLDILDAGLQTGHLHHALLGLGVDGSQHQLHNQSKQNHGKTVVAGQVVQNAQQPAKRHGNQIGQFKCKKHFVSSFMVLRHGTGSKKFPL